MHLKTIKIQRFRNFVEPQEIEIEPDVTALVGKNESGKTTILQALHRLNPANLRDSKFDLVTEYPRWRLSRDRKMEPDLDRKTRPIEAWFAFESDDLDACEDFLPSRPPEGTTCYVARSYRNTRFLVLQCPLEEVLRAAIVDAHVAAEEAKILIESETADAAKTTARETAKSLREHGEGARAKALGSFPGALERYSYLTGTPLDDDQISGLEELLPAFFYFSDYDLLPGEHDLHELAQKISGQVALGGADESVAALLSYAGASPEDFLGEDYDARKAELQASALDLTRKVFAYWTQNRDLEVDFDTELEEVDTNPNGTPVMHRILKVLMRDNRHGGIVTNFETRSAGFRWFFSFLAAFSKYQESKDPIVVLLDEPGTSLHGEAQKDFLRFIFEELGNTKKVLYTTHSQYLVDPSQYEKLRAVEDRSTRDNPDLGVAVSNVDVSSDPDTLLPIQAALGYSISQHLFLGAGRQLTVEGGSDFIYLQRFSEHLETIGRTALDPRLAAIPLGSASNTPAFVALFAKHLKVSVLLDGNRQGKDAQRVFAQAERALISETEIVVVGDVPGLNVTKPDIEDLLDPEDYLRLYNWAFDRRRTIDELPPTDERIIRRIESVDGPFDHALPAYELTNRKEEFFTTVNSVSVERFEELIKLLNATVSADE